MNAARRIAWLGGLAAALAVSSCGGPPSPAGTGDYLENSTWHLRSIDDTDVASGGTTPWFKVDPTEGRIEGFAGCNGFTGPYRAGGSTVTFGPLATTRRACTEASMTAMEARVLDILHNADGYRVDDGRLELMIDGRTRLRFEAGPARS